jgi:RHS repeat-associated protein
MPVAMTKGGSTYYLTNDQVGSLRVVADSAGNVVRSIENDSFGNIITDTNPSLSVPFGFAGGLHERDTDLVRFGYRDYDPDAGRWTAKDPIGFAGGDTDLYGYCLNDPINWLDPWGLTQCDIDIAVKIIKETQKDLKFPKSIAPSYRSDKYAGEYFYLTDTLKLNQNYLKKLTDKQAEDLLNTIVHELLHKKDPLWRQILDSFREHPDIEKETERRVKDMLERYLKQREAAPCN